MAREYRVAGPAIIKVRGRAGTTIATEQELGLAEGDIEISSKYYTRDIATDDFGDAVPADVMFEMAETSIKFTLVHFDDQILDTCIRQAMAGSVLGNTGSLAAAGTPMGGNQDLYAGNNFYVALHIMSQRFETTYQYCYMTGQPIRYPLGIKRSLVVCTFTSVPYGTATDQNVNGGTW